jgi:hypothetical protein
LDRKHSEDWQNRLARTVNSAACFSIAYVLLTYLYWFVTGLVGRLFSFDSFIYYYGIKFILNNHSWTRLKIIFIYSAGPFFMLYLALLCLFLYSRLKSIKTLLNVFFLWVFIVGISIFLAQFVIAALGIYEYNSLYYQGLAVTFAWLKLPTFLVYLMNVSMFVFMVYFGINSGKRFLVFSFSYSKVNSLVRRRKYFFETAMVPFILGALITIMAVFPKDPSAKGVLVLLGSTHIIYITIIGLILGIGWLALAYIEISKPELVRYKSFQLPNIFFIIFMFLSWALVYVTFRGVYLGK